MLKEPYERIANPIDKSINPIPNFTGPDGLNFDCQILERTGANTATVEKDDVEFEVFLDELEDPSQF